MKEKLGRDQAERVVARVAKRLSMDSEARTLF